MKKIKMKKIACRLLVVFMAAAFIPVFFANISLAEGEQDVTDETDKTQMGVSEDVTQEELAEYESELEEAADVDDFGYELIEIASIEDWNKFAESCSLDTWSQNKKIVLTDDLDINGQELSTVASFSGIFDGCGYTVYGINITASLSPTGLFETVTDSALVMNLNVKGTVMPNGAAQYVGGIAGKNYGKIINCSFSGMLVGNNSSGGIAGVNGITGLIGGCTVMGSIDGEARTGGIAGENDGIILLCENHSSVNADNPGSGANILDLDLDFDQTSTLSDNIRSTQGTNDTGGIAGYSSGILRLCENSGTVGYSGAGYNVGGIAGRTCGEISSCTNTGDVHGRKDVGGIAGQAEPSVLTNVSISALAELKDQLEDMGTLLDQAQADAADAAQSVTNYLNSMSSSVQAALSEAISIAASAAERAGSLTDSLGDSEISWDKETLEGLISSDGNIAAGIDLSELYSSLTRMSGSIGSLNTSVSTGAFGGLSSDLSAINNQYELIIETAFSKLDADNSTNLITDTSDADPESIVFGKIYNCENDGSVEGRINAGGIAGIMSIEFSSDPEDDISFEVNLMEEKIYELKDVILNCESRGDVTGKSKCSGGIVGRKDLGLVQGCEAYGSVASEGNYVGGIAGLNGSVIRNSCARISLSGAKYVGGITGYGKSESIDGSYSLTENCVSFVDITEAEQYFGAISGNGEGEYSGNVFLSETLNGLDNLSVAGQAEPISYEELKGMRELPEDFAVLTLRFVANDIEIASYEFSYGDSFDNAVFPEIPEKEGYYSRWDTVSLENLFFDTTVTAIYSEYGHAIASDEVRDGDRPVFFAQGNFNDTDKVEAERLDVSANKEILERWSIKIPDDGLDAHIVRFLPADAEENSFNIYILEYGNWTETEVTAEGSYLLFETSANTVEIAVVSAVSMLPVRGTAAIIILAVAAVVVSLFICARRRRIDKKQPELKEEKETAEKAENKKNRRKFKIVAVIAIVIAAAAICFLLIYPKLWPELKVIQAWKELNSNAQTDFTLAAEVRKNDEILVDLDCDISLLKTAEVSLTKINLDDIILYYADNVIYLEDASAYQVTEEYPDYGGLTVVLAGLFEKSDLSVSRESKISVYSISVTGDDAEKILAFFAPELTENISVNDFSVSLTLKGDNITQIDIGGSLVTGVGDKISVNALLKVAGTYDTLQTDIPEAILESIASGKVDAVLPLTKDTLELLSAWQKLSDEDPFSAQLDVTVDCGLIAISETVDWQRVLVNGVQINCLSKGGITIYLTDDLICGSDGNAVSEDEKSLGDYSAILTLAGAVIRSGGAAVEETDSGKFYTLTMDEEITEELVKAFVPGVEGTSAEFTETTLGILVEDGEIRRMSVDSGGSVTVLRVKLSAEISVELIVRKDAAAPAIPDLVRRALTGS